MHGKKRARFQFPPLFSKMNPVRVTPTMPGSAPAEFVSPKRRLQCFGLRSPWLEYSPASEKALRPSPVVMQRT
eukprot:scaffold682128_cov43-Prasinocladus_malaysianus.AAC.1